MAGQGLEQQAAAFIQNWKSYQGDRNRGKLSFERTPFCKEFIERGFISSRINPHAGEYAIHHAHTGCAFFTGSGELAFTEQGVALAKKICDLYRNEGLRMQVIKIEYEPAK